MMTRSDFANLRPGALVNLILQNDNSGHVPVMFMNRRSTLNGDGICMPHGAVAIIVSTSNKEFEEDGWSLVLCNNRIGWMYRYDFHTVVEHTV